MMLEVRNVHKKFENLEVLRGIDLDVNKGDVVAILGPSGSGKTTFLRCLNLLEKPTSGSVFFEGEDITRTKNIAAYRRKIGMVFQNFNVFPNMTVLENITLAPVLEKKIPSRIAVYEPMDPMLQIGTSALRSISSG